MSDGDVSLIRDEDVLRRMWQQTEDFSKKKEIRAHMYRLREERLRDLYSAETAFGKGYEFASSRTHSDSFADQSFQSMKSKEVRDADSPLKDYAYHTQGSKNPESVTRTDYTSSTSATAHLASSLEHHTESHATSKTIDSSNTQNIHGRSSSNIVSNTACFDNTNNKIVTRERGQGELISRKIEYPDENTRIVTETRSLPDGTTVTSTEREFRTPALITSLTSKSEQHLKQVHGDTNSSAVSTSSTQYNTEETKTDRQDIDRTFYDKRDIQTLRKNIDLDQTYNSKIVKTDNRFNVDYNQTFTDGNSEDTVQSDFIDHQDKFRRVLQEQRHTNNIETVDQRQDCYTEEIFKANSKKDDFNQHTTSTTNDYIQRKISSDLSPTHQAWASTLRGDTPPTSRTSTRASSPGSRTYQSSTSSLRSSISPEKTYKKPSSPSRSPTKLDRFSPTRKSPEACSIMHTNETRKTNETTDFIISQKSYQKSSVKSPSPQRKPQVDKTPRTSPEKSTTRQLSSPRTSPSRKQLSYQPKLQDNTKSDITTMSPNHRSIRPNTSPERKTTNKSSRSSSSPSKICPESNYQSQTPKYSTPDREYPDRMSESSVEYITTKNLESRETYDKIQNDKKESYRLVDEETKVLACFDEMLSKTFITPDKDKQNKSPALINSSASVSIVARHPDQPSTQIQPSTISHRNYFDKSPSPMRTKPEKTSEKHLQNKSPSPTRIQTEEVTETSPLRKSPSPSHTKSMPECPQTKKHSSVEYESPKSFPKTRSLDKSPSRSPKKTSCSPEKDQLGKRSSPMQTNLESTLKKKSVEQYPSQVRPQSRSSPEKDPLDKSLSSVRPRVENNTDKKLQQKSPSPTRTQSKHFPEKDRLNKSPSPIRSKQESVPEKNPPSTLIKPTNDSEKQYLDKITSPSRINQTTTSEIKPMNKSKSPTPSKIEISFEKRPSDKHLSPSRIKQESISIHQKNQVPHENMSPNPESLVEKPEKRLLHKSPSPTRTNQKVTPKSLPLNGCPSPVHNGVANTPQRHSPYKSTSPSRSESASSPEKQASNNTPSPTRSKPSSFLERNPLNKTPSPTRNKPSISPERRRLNNSPSTNIKSVKESSYGVFRSPSPPSKDSRTFTDEEYVDKTNTKDNSFISEENFISLNKKEQKRLTSPHKTQKSPMSSPFTYVTREGKQKHALDFISHETRMEEIDKKSINTQRIRQLVTPSTSPTRKPKTIDKSPTEQSSPTTSVSEILYFNSSPPDIPKSLLTDLDNRNECLEINKKSKTISSNENRNNDWEIKRSPSPSKIPRRSSSPDQTKQQPKDLPRKSSLKKPSSDNIQKPVEQPPTMFRISPSKDKKILPEHKIVKKDRPIEPDIETKVREKPPLERRETYEERCRKILGMMDDNISTTKRDNEIVSVESPSSARKPDYNISAAPDDVSAIKVPPTSHYSTDNNMKTKQISTESNYHKDETKKEVIKTSTFEIPSKDSSRDSSPTKLQDIICVKSVLENNENDSQVNTLQEIATNRLLKSPISPERQARISPHQEAPTTDFLADKASRSRSSSPLKPIDDLRKVTNTKTEQFISSERETEILDRVQQSLRKLSPNRKSTSREQSPNKISDSFIITQTKDANKNENISREKEMSDSLESTASEHISKKSEQNRNVKYSTKRNVSPVKKLNVPKRNTNETIVHDTDKLSKKNTTVSNKEVQADTTIGIHKTRDSLKKLSEHPSVSPHTAQHSSTESKKTTTITKQNSFSKSSICKVSTTTNKSTKSLIATKSKNNNKETRDVVDWKTQNEKQKNFNKDNIEKKVDMKFSRTNSDTSVRNKKPSPQRNTSKPEIHIVDATTISAKTTKSSTKKDVLVKNSKCKIVTNKETKTKLIPKPKSATALNVPRDEHDVIVKVEQAKSSRENSPDNVCPTPLNFEEKELGKPRLPDEVSEPDDDLRQRAHNIIHETESIVDDIVEIVEDEELFAKKTEPDHDECLLTVTEKVTKFNNRRDASPIKSIDTANKFTESEEIGRSYIVDEKLKSDDCLLSVSEKVSKFSYGQNTDKNVRNATRSIILKESTVDNANFEDDFTRLSVNAKAHLFIETSDKSVESTPTGRSSISKPSRETDSHDTKRKTNQDYYITETKEHDDNNTSYSKETISSHAKVRGSVSTNLKPTDKIESTKNTGLYNDNVRTTEDECIAETKEHDDLSLSYTKETVSSHAKVKEHVSPNLKPMDKIESTKNTVLYNDEVRTTQDDCIEERKENDDLSLSYTNETVSSHAKVKEYVSRNSKPSDKPETARMTALRSSDTVKKAKALFENIASTTTQTSHEKNYSKITKLTDIGVTKKIMKADNQSPKEKKTLSIPESAIDRIQGRLDYQQKNVLSNKTYSDDTIERQTKIATHTKENTNTRNTELHTSPATQPQKSSTTIADTHSHQSTMSHQKHTSEIRESQKEEMMEQSTRRGSGKFGVELRRTSTDRLPFNNERRESSSDQRQLCIEKIFDLSVLEQLLEKVVGYEQRRRIRAQMRVAKNSLENEHIDGYQSPSKSNIKSQSVPERKKSASPERLRTPTKSDKPTTISHIEEPAGKENIPKVFRIKNPIRNETHSTTKSPTRQPSPEKRTRVPSPTKTTIRPTNKTNRVNEYTTAYMHKVGLNEADEATVSKTKKEVIKMKEHKAIETRDYSKCESTERFVEDTKKTIAINGKRSPSREKQTKSEQASQEKTLKLHQRTPSPDFKQPKADTAKNKSETAIRTVYDIEKKIKTKQVQDEKPTWVTNRNLKKVPSETRTFTTKKMETGKIKYRAASPVKGGGLPIDAITSSYGPGPLDKDGKPLFGIKALRNGTSNYQVKGVVVREEYRARDGEEPTGAVTVTRYSSGPPTRGSRLHGLAALTAPKAVIETSSRNISTSERRESVERAMRADERTVTAASAAAADGADGRATSEDVESERLRDGVVCRDSSKTREVRTESKARHSEKMVRQSSVKTLTEKFIKNTTNTLKSERSAYPKAGLILRSSGLKDGAAGHSQQNVLRRTGSQRSVDSGEEHAERCTTTTVTVESRGGRGAQKHSATTTTTKVQSFLDSDAKVTGVQDILSRMKNADIVLTAGDNSEDAEARALLNKFLGASVLMAGMQGYVTERPGGSVVVQERVRSVQATRPASSHDDPLDPSLWDERLLRRQLEESNDYEERRQLRARLRALMADQEGTSTAEGAASADVTDEGGDPRGESLLLPLLQGLLSDGGDRLLAGLGSAGADVVADVRRSLARLRAALAPPTAHPNAQALLMLADRLEDALDAADRLDGCKRKPRRRPRSQRHTVGVTQEELEKARLAVDRDQLDGLTNTDQPQSLAPAPATDPTPPRDDTTRLSYHSAVHVKQKASPIAHSVSYESTPIVNRDAQLVPRRDMNRTDTYRHSIADVDRRPFAQRNGIAAIAQKFDAQVETVAARKGPPPMIQRTPNRFEVGREEPKKGPTTLYRPPPPSYNFAAPPADDTPPPRPLANRRARMKRANTIDIPKPLGTHLLNGRDEKSNSRTTAGLVPEFQPQTDNDRKFIAFMQKNEDSRPPWSRGTAQMNWSNRFGNIKNTFESREAQDEHYRTGIVPPLTAKRFWRVNNETTTRPFTMPPTSPAQAPRLAKTGFSELQRGYSDGENLSTDASSPKPFVAKPIPVNQFSHAPMSAFKPPKKLISPTGTPAHVWSPPSIISPQPSPVHNAYNSPFSPAPPGPPTPPSSITEEKPRKMSNSVINKFKSVDPMIGSSASTLHSNKEKYMSPTTGPVWPPTGPRPNYHIKTIPSQNELAAPELVKKIDVAQAHENEINTFTPSVDVRKLQIEFYEKQIRDKNRRDPPVVTNGYHEGGTSRTYSRTFLTPPAGAPTAVPGSVPFVPLQQTPDIEKARAHKVDYLPDVVMNNKRPNLSENEPVEYRTVTRVMRGPISQQATITGGVRTRYDDNPRASTGTTAAKNLKGVLQKFSASKREVPSQIEKKNRQERENGRPQVVIPPVSSRESDPVCRPPPVFKYDNTSRSPPARAVVSSDSSEGGSRGSARSTPSPGGRFGTRRVVTRANSMQLLTVPKLYEGGVARDELTDKRRTVEAYFAGKTSPNVNMIMARGSSVVARGPRSTGGFALGRSRTMPTVTELQFLDESNTEDAFEDLVSALA